MSRDHGVLMGYCTNCGNAWHDERAQEMADTIDHLQSLLRDALPYVDEADVRDEALLLAADIRESMRLMGETDA